MTFKDLQKLIESQPNPKQTRAFQRLKDKPFWYWDAASHKSKDRTYKGDCCFNHIISLPRKDGIEKPMFDYEREIYFALTKSGYLNSYPSTKQFNIRPDNILFPLVKVTLPCIRL